jgi:hypothetical protein
MRCFLLQFDPVTIVHPSAKKNDFCKFRFLSSRRPHNVFQPGRLVLRKTFDFRPTVRGRCDHLGRQDVILVIRLHGELTICQILSFDSVNIN